MTTPWVLCLVSLLALSSAISQYDFNSCRISNCNAEELNCISDEAGCLVYYASMPSRRAATLLKLSTPAGRRARTWRGEAIRTTIVYRSAMRIYAMCGSSILYQPHPFYFCWLPFYDHIPCDFTIFQLTLSMFQVSKESIRHLAPLLSIFIEGWSANLPPFAILNYYKCMRGLNEESFNISDVELFRTYKEKHYATHKKCPTSLAWNTTGSLLLTAEAIIKCWNFAEDALEKGSEVKGHDSSIEHAEFGSANVVGTLSRDSLRFWDVRENSPLRQLKVEKRGKHDFVRFSWNQGDPNGEMCRLAVLNRDNAVIIYDYRALGSPLATILPKINSSAEVTAAVWDPTNAVLFVVGGESAMGTISLYDGETFELLCDPYVSHCARITDISFSKDGQKFVTVGEDSLAQLLTLPDMICERVYSSRSDAAFRRVSMHPDGTYFAASCDSNSIDIFNSEKGGQSYRIKCSQNQEVLQWHPKRLILAYIDQQDKKRSLDRGEDSYVHLFTP